MQPRTCHAGRCLSLGALAVAVGTLSCGDDGTGPPTVASVAVTSPIGDRLAMGRTVQLSADARDSRGAAVTAGIYFVSIRAGRDEGRCKLVVER